MNRIILKKDEWMGSQLSIAMYLGVCRVDGRVLRLDRRSMCLIRDDYFRLLKPLGVKTLIKADKRYGSGRKSKIILFRLYHIVLCQKRLERQNQSL